MAIYKITMEDGSQENVTLGMGALAELSRRQPELYQRYRALYSMIGGKNTDELIGAEMIYIAYRAANINRDDCMDLDTFLNNMTDSREEIAQVYMQLFGVKEKKPASVMPSGRQHGKNRKQR